MLFLEDFLKLFNPADAALAEIDLEVAGKLPLHEVFQQFYHLFKSLHYTNLMMWATVAFAPRSTGLPDGMPSRYFMSIRHACYSCAEIA